MKKTLENFIPQRILCGPTFSAHLGACQAVKLLDPVGGVCLLCEKALNCHPKWWHCFIVPPALHRILFHVSAPIWCCLDRCAILLVTLHFGALLTCHSLMVCDDDFLTYLPAFCASYSVWWHFAHIDQIVQFSLLSFKSSLYIWIAVLNKSFL